jgi:NAD(P)-dependent dehydrogenase (short-subunit alcohol dehydrogenase family)
VRIEDAIREDAKDEEEAVANLEGRVVLITSVGRKAGLGRAIALDLARSGGRRLRLAGCLRRADQR